MVWERMWQRRWLLLISDLLGDRREWAKVEKLRLEGTAGTTAEKAREGNPKNCSQETQGMSHLSEKNPKQFSSRGGS